MKGMKYMDFKLYKLQFQGAVHFGRQNLDESEYSFCADTLFSALCQEAVRMGEETLDKFYHFVKAGQLLFSDAFPYIKDTFFIPKPMKNVEMADYNGNSVARKAYKKLKYIPMELLDTYLQGKYDVLNRHDFEAFGQFEMKSAVSVRGEEETVPYRIGTYSYRQGNGLYIIVGFQEEEMRKLTEQLLENLSFSGIGGKRAAGFGRFGLLFGKMPDDFRKRLQGTGERYMSLSVSLPKEEELDAALNGAEYLLLKRSGFVASDKYAPEQMRKKDLYVFKAGSCFLERFYGDIYDVSHKCAKHPVYRYAKPMLMEV